MLLENYLKTFFFCAETLFTPNFLKSVQQVQQQQQLQEVNNNNISNQNNQQVVEEEVRMEAMTQLDASLVAYLTGGEQQLNAAPQCADMEMEPQLLTLKKMEQLCSSNSSSSVASACSYPEAAPAHQNQANINEKIITDPQDTLHGMFCRMSGIKLHLEALTLQAAGTKRMELLQNDIRPFFTVECQLSHELIKSVPRYDMYHIMQFESEKFQSLTQCTRFGQEAIRSVKLELNNENDVINNNVNGEGIGIVGADQEAQLDFGRIYFTVWWREPGTCLNEMLGTGVLALEELYAASVLEQCKRIVIQRRNEHLANLYLKLSVQVGDAKIDERCQKSLLKENVAATAAAAAASDADVVVNNVENGLPTVTGEYVAAAVHASSITGRMRVEDNKIQ